VKVYIEQLDCTGSGQCEMIAPELFVVLDDGLATVKDADGMPVPDGAVGVGVFVPPALEAKVRDAADICPGACIYCVDATGAAKSSVPHHTVSAHPPGVPPEVAAESPPPIH
jgi:ferredoxin